MAARLNGSDVLVVDIDPRDHRSLLAHGIPEPQQWRAWAPDRRDDAGWVALLIAAGLSLGDSAEYRSVSLNVVTGFQSVETYFTAFLAELLRTCPADTNRRRERFILLNLFPFSLCTTLVDKIVSGVVLSAENPGWSDADHFVLLLRNLDWFLKSNAFREANRTGTPPE